jgi:hypothetical protein
MSFRRPKTTYHRTPSPSKSSAPSTPATRPSTPSSTSPTRSIVHLIPVADVLPHKRPPGTSGLFLSRPQYLVTLPGRVNLTHAPLARGSPLPRHPDAPDSPCNAPLVPDDPFVSWENGSAYDNIIEGVLTTHGPLTDLERRTRHRLKKKRQWKKWYEDIIPTLLQPHLRLLRETHFLRNRPLQPIHSCVCETPPRSLTVICVYFERKVQYPFASRY